MHKIPITNRGLISRGLERAMISRDCLLAVSAPAVDMSGISRITSLHHHQYNTTHTGGAPSKQKTQKTRQMDKLNKTGVGGESVMIFIMIILTL